MADDLLKRADNFNSLNDGISGKNQVVVDLVNELATRIRELEKPDKILSKRIAVGFFTYWWNRPGTNTNQGFDEYWNKLLSNELELPNKEAVQENVIPAGRKLRYNPKFER